MNRKDVIALTTILIFVVFVISLSFSPLGQRYMAMSPPGTEFDVRVVNGFTDNSSLALVIWCSSEHGDLGGRALQERDEFSWTARTDVWGNPNYVCTMKWDHRRKRFDAFRVRRDVVRCSPLRRCSWLVTQDGFYFSSDESNWKKDYSWPN